VSDTISLPGYGFAFNSFKAFMILAQGCSKLAIIMIYGCYYNSLGHVNSHKLTSEYTCINSIPKTWNPMNTKTKIYFGPPLSILTEKEGNTMEISGRINRTAERYLEIMKEHGLELNAGERACLTKICDFGFMAPYEIRELAIDVRMSEFDAEDLDKEVLAKKLEAASFADLVAVVEELGF
jgi:hypothetical protein